LRWRMLTFLKCRRSILILTVTEFGKGIKM
jgi:hypothetical protein